MDESWKYWNYHLKWTPERKILVRRGSGWTDQLFVLYGPGEPQFPEHPITKQEFYAILSNLAAQGFMDNLLDF
jgi:hypothetical protein